MVYIFIVLIIVYIIAVLATAPERERQKILARNNSVAEEEAEKETLNEAIKRFDISPALIEDFSKKFVYILDKNNRRIVRLTYSGHPRYEYDATYYDFENFVDVSVVVEKETVTSTTSNDKQFKGALVGGILAGPTGAIIGSQSGNKSNITTSEEMVSNIRLKLLMVNTDNSSKTITFLQSDEPISKATELYKNKFNRATNWENELRAYMLGVKNEQKKPTSNSSNISIADEIKKLHTLVQDGILTEEEFALQKEKILSK